MSFALPRQFWDTRTEQPTNIQVGDRVEFENREDGCHVRFSRLETDLAYPLAFGESAHDALTELFLTHQCDFVNFLEALTNALDALTLASRVLEPPRSDPPTGNITFARFEIASLEPKRSLLFH